jgi:3-dehydroquinate synthase
MTNDFVISPKELRDSEIRDQFRGYDHDEVNSMLERAALTLEYLALVARGRAGSPPIAPITPIELIDGDLSEVMRGYHKDTVNDLAERAARTIELLESRSPGAQPPAPRADHDEEAPEPITARVTTLVETMPSFDFGSVGASNVVVTVELGARSYDIHIGPGAIAQLLSLVAARRKVAIVSQPEILRLHGDRVTSALDVAGVEHDVGLIADGEHAKTLTTIDDLCARFAETGLLRDDIVVALGGGVVGDVAGFAASVYHRGIDVIQVPTTLLAMVDSAIGGKTGVNLAQGKNLVGAFHQPRAVLIDPSVLATLPDREFRCGLGEVAKYALMGDSELFAILTEQRDAVLQRDPEVLTQVIQRSARVKAGFVALDERERTGQRAHLNYGHTLAHAIEVVSEHALVHGEAVAIGLVFAGALAGALERIDAEAVRRHHELIAGLALPTRAPERLDRAELIEVMRRDKKAVGGLTFVLAGSSGLERVDDPPEHAIASAFAAVGID